MSAFRWLTRQQPTTESKPAIRLGLLGCVTLLLALTGCNSGSYDIVDVSGKISGLTKSGLVLRISSTGETSHDLNVDAGATSFDFGRIYESSKLFEVVVATQPTGETCSVAKGSGGGVGSSLAYADVVVSCGPSAQAIAGSISGLTATGLVLQVNGANDLAVAANAATFSFTNPLANGAAYAVTILTQPTGQFCQVSGGSGSVSASMAAIQLTCGSNSQTFSTVGYTTWTVPAGVTAIQVVATGGGGAGTYGNSNGGSAAIVTSMLSVQPGETVSIYVGNGGSLGYESSSGGGLTYVGDTAVIASNFVIAGGGGGAGYSGGNGGNAGSAGVAGGFGGGGGAGSNGVGGAAGTGSGVVGYPATAGGTFSDIATAGSGSGGTGGGQAAPSGVGGTGISATIGNGGAGGISGTGAGGGGGGYGGGGGGGDGALNAFAGGGGGGGGGGSTGPAGHSTVTIATSGKGLGGVGGSAGAAGSVTIVWP